MPPLPMYDSSGNGHHGFYVGNPTNVPGLVHGNAAKQFPGSPFSVGRVNEPVFDANQAFTIEGWVQNTPIGGYFVAQSDADHNVTAGLYWDVGTAGAPESFNNLLIFNTRGSWSSGPLPVLGFGDPPHYFVATLAPDPTNFFSVAATFYWDGIQHGPGRPGGGVLAGVPTQIQIGQGEMVTLDEIAIYEYVLNANAVQFRYNLRGNANTTPAEFAGPHGYNAAVMGVYAGGFQQQGFPAAYYHLDETSGGQQGMFHGVGMGVGGQPFVPVPITLNNVIQDYGSFALGAALGNTNSTSDYPGS